MNLHILIVTTPSGLFDIIISRNIIHKEYDIDYNYDIFKCKKNKIKEDIKNNVNIFNKYITNKDVLKDIFYCNELKTYMIQEIIKQIRKIENDAMLISHPVSPCSRSNIPLSTISEENRRYSPKNCMEWVFDLALLGYRFDYETDKLVEKID